MAVTGEQVLAYLVAREREGLYDAGVGSWSAAIAHRVVGPSADGRAVRAPLKRLERAGLVERMPDRPTEPLFRTTARGREVNGILDAITAARGGTFQPRQHAGITSIEEVGLR